MPSYILPNNHLEIHWGADEPVFSDIAGDKNLIRKRGWVKRFFRANGIESGDVVVVEKIDAYRYRVYPCIQPTPVAIDIEEPSQPKRVKQEEYRILRDTAKSKRVKKVNDFECQVCCKKPIRLPNGQKYAEGHHIIPLGRDHNGLDEERNIICVCPDCHVKLDYGVISLDKETLKGHSAHTVSDKSIDYHNTNIWGKVYVRRVRQ